MSSRLLLDCNHLSACLNRVSPLRDRIQAEHRSGRRFITCYPVLCELEVGIQQTSRVTENRRLLDRMFQVVRIWPFDEITTQLYGSARLELKKKGRALSQVDMMLVALARQHNLTILTTDRDLEALPDLRLENWVTPSP